MKRRSRAARKPVKTRPRNAAARRSTPKTVHRCSSPAAGKETNVARLTRDLKDALAATSEVLRVISGSPSDAQPVFDTIAKSAARLCKAQFCHVFRFDGRLVHFEATHGCAPEVTAVARSAYPMMPGRGSAAGRSILSGTVEEIPDIHADRDYERGHMAEIMNFRSIVSVPMLKDGHPIGAIALARSKTGHFPKQQIDLLRTFAAQAVIAIENVRLFRAEQQRTRELTESLEQQTATSEVLRVISKSPADLKPVFQAMLENATRICEAKFGTLYRFESNAFHWVAQVGAPLEFAKFLRQRGPFQPPPGTMLDHVLRTKQVRHTADETAEAVLGPSAQLGGARSVVAVPMLKDDALIGAIIIYRQEVQPFTDKQIALVQNFAAQAVIAIENTRLLNELRESLQQQTATADVLKVISSSPGELAPVFQSMLVKAVQICEAKFGVLFRCYHDSEFHAAAWVGVTPEYEESLRKRQSFRPAADAPLGRLLRTKELVHTADELAEKSSSPAAKYGGARSLVAVPMRKDNELVGAFVIYRTEVRPFATKQIELVQNFAAQAVIAIENARLLSELHQRTADLTESLERQTATSEVLQVISSSTFDLEKVFGTLLETAMRLCESTVAGIWLADGDHFKLAAARGPSDFVKFATEHPVKRSRGTVTGRTALEGKLLHIPDVLADPEYTASDYQSRGQYRSALGVPLLRQGETIGVFTLSRSEAMPFNTAQIELVQNFAAQAVVAVENTRLLNELRQSLQQQTATAEVLKVISRSTFDLQTVLDTLMESAARLCDADKATITRERDGAFYSAEAYGFSREFMDYVKDIPIKAEKGSASGRALLEGRVIHIPDVKTDPEYTWVETQRRGDYRTILCVPMLREGVPIGVLILTRSEARPFTDKQIELVTTFADQAAIAIENVRLFDEIQDKSRQLEEASQHKSQFLANMSHELRTPLNAILGYTELMTDGAYGEPSEKMLGILKRLEANGKHLLGLINDVLDLSKIEAGQLVLELSDYSVQDIAQTVRSTLEPLAADKKLAFKVELAPELPPGHG